MSQADKIRFDLIPEYGTQEVAKVLTTNLKKYKANQWKYGMSWSEIISSLKKHLNAFERGVDFSEDDNLHIAEVASNAMILAEFYHIYPQGDDRVIAPVNKPIVGCDLDGVIFDFNKGYQDKFNMEMVPYWTANYELSKHLKELESDKDFWVNLPLLHKPAFEVDYYITSRSISKEWIEESLQKNNLPCAPVYTVPWNVSKLSLLKELKIDIYIDDKYENYKEATSNGIFCYLMDAPHNVYYNVGHKRIYDLNIPIK